MKRTTHILELEMDDEREVVFAGWMILEAVNSPRVWGLFWDAVQLARVEHHQSLVTTRHAEDDGGDPGRAARSGSRSTTHQGRSRAARVIPLRPSLAAEPSADAGPTPDETGP
jgi:hypothetical protein